MCYRQLFALAGLFVAATSGCAMHSDALRTQVAAEAAMHIPRELEKASLTDYRVEIPDILLINAVNSIRLPDAPLEVGDTVVVKVQNGMPLSPTSDPEIAPLQHQLELQLEFEFKAINGAYTINPDGTADFGPVYGRVALAGLTTTEAQAAVFSHLSNTVGLLNPQVSLTLPNLGGKQIIAGEHLVRPDGTVFLGIYGQVHVCGMTLPEIKAAVEAHLSQFVIDPQVSVDVLSYNSKVYYVIMDGGGFGETVVRLPFTGNETVLDAMANVQGLSQVSSKKIWIARPAPSSTQAAQILDVHWSEIASEGITSTNYQVLPGDRIYVQADKLISIDNALSKLFAPIERIFGIALLGNGTASAFEFYGQNFGNN